MHTHIHNLAVLIHSFISYPPRPFHFWLLRLPQDAAAMPLHWIYDVNSIAAILEQAGRTDTPGERKHNAILRSALEPTGYFPLDVYTHTFLLRAGGHLSIHLKFFAVALCHSRILVAFACSILQLSCRRWHAFRGADIDLCARDSRSTERRQWGLVVGRAAHCRQIHCLLHETCQHITWLRFLLRQCNKRISRLA